MNPTIDRLTFEMEDARRDIDWLETQQTYCEQKAQEYESKGVACLHSHFKKSAEYWKQWKQEAHQIYYRAKAELKTLTDKQQVA